jgi:hypothetical protein
LIASIAEIRARLALFETAAEIAQLVEREDGR